ncbi:hypothetical protein M426DRAFT_7291 [Hypoxylon sp. CI-4A]|nr:hypothetical protein M426DRAFT_7291 [Hypoxylon sp. CI-4A]
MVVSTANQLSTTYTLWKRFTFPSDSGPRDAVAVPAYVGDKLNSAYALIIDMAVANVIYIIFGLVLFAYMNRAGKFGPGSKARNTWTMKNDLPNLMIETIVSSTKHDWTSPKITLLLFAFLAVFAGQKATGVLVPPLLILNNSAPVDPQAIYVPDRSNTNDATSASLFPLEVPRALRALGSTVSEELRYRVNVSDSISLGQTDNGEEILRIDYSYHATGADFGLQKFPELTLNVDGSCVTDYSWWQFTETADYNTKQVAVDTYYRFGNESLPWLASLFDGRAPIANFFLNKVAAGTLPTSNSTWGAIVSSVNRTSFTAGTDPWYFTVAGSNSLTTASYSVLRARPALSCWEDNVWSYKGQNTTVDGLNSTVVPGLDLPSSLQEVLQSTLGSPMIQIVGQHLQSSALLSSTTASGEAFDAGSSSVHDDLERLVQAAYVATVNCLTDLTLYKAGANDIVSNIARGASGQAKEGVSDFVVWSPEVTTLSTLVIIVVPSVFVGTWLLNFVLLYWTPVRRVNDLAEGEPEKAGKDSTENQLGTDPNPATPIDVEAGQGVGKKEQQ